jgi:hypothetical protein
MTTDMPTAASFDRKGSDVRNYNPPDLRPLDEDMVAQIVESEISDAETFRGSGIQRDQSEAIEYYYGRPLGNEVKGRSQVVLTDVRDTIEWILPTLMRIFFGGRHVVRYVPQGPEDVEFAKQATDYAQFLGRRGNCGFLVFHDWFKDALLEKIGAITIYYEDKVRRELERYAELSEDELDELLSEEGVEPVALEETVTTEEAPEPPASPMPMEGGAGLPAPPGMPPGAPQVDPATGQPMPPGPPMMPQEPAPPLEVSQYEAHIRRLKPQGRIRIEGVPQEEFLIASRARRLDDDCPFVGRRTKVTYSDLRGMGFAPELIENLPTDDIHAYSQQSIERREDEQITLNTAYERPDWASREVWLTECFIRIDEDGDGYAELRRILCAGDSGIKILEDDEVSHIPIATLCPVPIPHKFYGLSMADLLKDLQRIRSTLLRQMMDNIYLQNNSRYEVVEGEVEIEDLLTTSPGGVVRVQSPGMVNPLVTQPLGPGAFNLLEYLHGVKEDRTGITRYNQGRDASSLNQTATGLSAIMEAANLRIEMIARIFAETGVTRLYEQLLYVMRENPVKEEVLRIRDEWVPMDPRMWRANLDVEVEVGLGTQQTAVRVDNMMLLYDLQKQVKETDGRMVTPENVYAVVERIPEAMGFPTQGLFFTEPDPSEPEPEPDPDPKLLEIEGKSNEAKAKLELEMQTLNFRKYQADLDAQLRREEMVTRVKVAQIQGQANVAQAEVHADARAVQGNGADRAQ